MFLDDADSLHTETQHILFESGQRERRKTKRKGVTHKVSTGEHKAGSPV